MPGADGVAEQNCEHDGQHGDGQRAHHTDRQCRAQSRVAHRHVRPGDEHDEGEAEVGHEGEGVIARLQRSGTGSAQGNSHRDLTHDHRHVQGPWQRQHRPQQPGEKDQREGLERHRSAMRQGMSVFSST